MTSTEIVAAGPGPQAGLDDHIYNRLLKERIIFLGSDVRDDNANAICAQMLLLAAEDPDEGHLALHQLPGWLGHRRHGDLRRHAVDPQRRRDRRDGHGRLDGSVPPVGRRARQALRHPARAGHDAPALRRHRRHGVRHQDPGRAAAAHQEADGRAHRAAHRPDRSTRSRRTPTATGGSPPRRPRSTASSTRSSPRRRWRVPGSTTR